MGLEIGLQQACAQGHALTKLQPACKAEELRVRLLHVRMPTPVRCASGYMSGGGTGHAKEPAGAGGSSPASTRPPCPLGHPCAWYTCPDCPVLARSLAPACSSSGLLLAHASGICAGPSAPLLGGSSCSRARRPCEPSSLGVIGHASGGPTSPPCSGSSGAAGRGTATGSATGSGRLKMAAPASARTDAQLSSAHSAYFAPRDGRSTRACHRYP